MPILGQGLHSDHVVGFPWVSTKKYLCRCTDVSASYGLDLHISEKIMLLPFPRFHLALFWCLSRTWLACAVGRRRAVPAPARAVRQYFAAIHTFPRGGGGGCGGTEGHTWGRRNAGQPCRPPLASHAHARRRATAVPVSTRKLERVRDFEERSVRCRQRRGGGGGG